MSVMTMPMRTGKTNWLNAEPTVSIKVGNTTITPAKTEAGTGYFKEVISGEKITSSMGNISVKITTAINATNQQTTSWGSVYWQYFENLDKITTAATPMSLRKQLFIQRNSDRGPVITPVNDNDNENECIICTVNRKNTIFIPCGHIALCIQCSNEYYNRNSNDFKCVICKQMCTHIQKIFTC